MKKLILFLLLFGSCINASQAHVCGYIRQVCHRRDATVKKPRFVEKIDTVEISSELYKKIHENLYQSKVIIQDLELRIRSLEDDLIDKKYDLALMMKKRKNDQRYIDILEKARKEKDKIMSGLKWQLLLKDREIEELKQKVAALQKENRALQKENRALQGRAKQLESELLVTKTHYSDLQKEILRSYDGITQGLKVGYLFLK